MKYFLIKALFSLILLAGVAKADTYLPVIHHTVLGSTVPLALEPTAEPTNPEGTGRDRQPGHAVVQATVTRYEGEDIEIILLEPGHVGNVVHLDLLVKREREVVRREVWLKLGETQEIWMHGGSLIVESRGDGSLVLRQTLSRADWTIIGTALWV